MWEIPTNCVNLGDREHAATEYLQYEFKDMCSVMRNTWNSYLPNPNEKPRTNCEMWASLAEKKAGTVQSIARLVASDSTWKKL